MMIVQVYNSIVEDKGENMYSKGNRRGVGRYIGQDRTGEGRNEARMLAVL